MGSRVGPQGLITVYRPRSQEDAPPATAQKGFRRRAIDAYSACRCSRQRFAITPIPADPMIEQSFGAPQIAALLVLVQRGLEEVYSERNTRALMAEGGREAGRDYYPVVAITHLAWIAALFLLLSPSAPILWPLLVLYLLLQVARYWIIATLGRYWTHRIITLD